MKRILKCFLLSAILFAETFSQTLTRSDFKIGVFDLDKPINSIIKKYGVPISKKFVEGNTDTTFDYKNFTVWVDSQDGKISAFQIIQSDFKLSRGISIGDSLSKVIRLFKEPDDTGIRFNRLVGPSDDNFTNYSFFLRYSFKTDKFELHFNEYYYWFIVFYVKEDRVMRMLYYKGVFE